MAFGGLDPPGWAVALAVGLFTGVVSGLMGVGGGYIMVPASTLLLGLTQQQAQGVSLLVIVPTALAGAYAHWRHGNLNLRAALLIAPSAILAGLLGARLAQLLPGPVLRAIFGILLLYFAQRYLGLEAWLRRRFLPRVPPEAVEPPPPPPREEEVPGDLGRVAP